MHKLTTEQKGLIFNIQRFSIHDGVGIRTLVFLKGCPLRCIWCSNPESQSFDKEIMFFKEKCIGCRRCEINCPNSCVSAETLEIEAEKCSQCGICADSCCADAKKNVGEWKSVDELICEIEKDRIFFRNSDGGVTIGGGEPLGQPEFTAKLLERCKEVHLHTAIETCGLAGWDSIKNIFNYVDHVFYDLKHMDSDKHKILTGAGNEIIKGNALKIAKMGKTITFRVPLIPGCNDNEENIRRTGEFVLMTRKNNRNINIELLEYHALGENKYNGLNRKYRLSGLKSDKNIRLIYNDLLKKMGCPVIE